MQVRPAGSKGVSVGRGVVDDRVAERMGWVVVVCRRAAPGEEERKGDAGKGKAAGEQEIVAVRVDNPEMARG